MEGCRHRYRRFPPLCGDFQILAYQGISKISASPVLLKILKQNLFRLVSKNISIKTLPPFTAIFRRRQKKTTWSQMIPNHINWRKMHLKNGESGSQMIFFYVNLLCTDLS